jgi:hypothetical protein
VDGCGLWATQFNLITGIFHARVGIFGTGVRIDAKQRHRHNEVKTNQESVD